MHHTASGCATPASIRKRAVSWVRAIAAVIATSAEPAGSAGTEPTTNGLLRSRARSLWSCQAIPGLYGRPGSSLPVMTVRQGVSVYPRLRTTRCTAGNGRGAPRTFASDPPKERIGSIAARRKQRACSIGRLHDLSASAVGGTVCCTAPPRAVRPCPQTVKMSPGNTVRPRSQCGLCSTCRA